MARFYWPTLYMLISSEHEKTTAIALKIHHRGQKFVLRLVKKLWKMIIHWCHLTIRRSSTRDQLIHNQVSLLATKYWTKYCYKISFEKCKICSTKAYCM